MPCMLHIECAEEIFHWSFDLRWLRNRFNPEIFVLSDYPQCEVAELVRVVLASRICTQMNTNRHHYIYSLWELLLTLIHGDNFLWHIHVFLQLGHLVLIQFGRSALLDPIGIIVQEFQLHRLKKSDGLGCIQIFWFLLQPRQVSLPTFWTRNKWSDPEESA
jgi:hypothetical protein